ncbi:mucoidy inhibitor MuiA family protein [Candidatus Chrysopegis kryptomonas]|uniref:Mucoidy inhibitor MuiA family protein n=1 Tax=Candidatus Chryseopegocella kryptomonas TaxID=1633643 RepID=A0A0P1MT64_9BACT|nr:mucoidy inhibitor MuiA family protein [Candidatus Chrysopegis kryptomonas]CUS99144.1 conserved hypothetical protein [Candidatus Chrysopegis kryptomonas]
MRKFLFLILTFFVLQISNGVEHMPKSKISFITIYPNGAFITKLVETSLKKGENLIKISGFPESLNNQSVQVEILKGDGVKISDVKVEETYLESPEVEKIKKLKAKLDSLNDLITSKQGELDVVLGKIELLKKLTPASEKQKFTVSEIESYLKFFSKTLGENIKEKNRIEKEIEDLKAEKKKVEDELEQISSVKKKGKNVEIAIYSNSDKNVELKVSYFVYGVSWNSGYEVRANSNVGKVDFDYFSFVRQMTGEDWIDVPAEISTAPVAVSGTPPELSQWTIDIYQPPVRSEKRIFMEMPRKEKVEIPEIIEPFYVSPEFETSITSVSFKFQKLNIPSDNQSHKIFLASFSQESQLVYYAVPKLSRYAYLRVKLKNDFGFPILPGEAKIYVDGKYISSSLIQRILPGQMFDLSLGVDEAIKINRNLKNKFTEYIGVFGGTVKVSYEYETEIENGKGVDVFVEVKENYPISRNEKIKVVLESPDEKEAEIGENGIITWKFNLKAGEKKILKLKFYVEHPKDVRVYGLD